MISLHILRKLSSFFSNDHEHRLLTTTIVESYAVLNVYQGRYYMPMLSINYIVWCWQTERCLFTSSSIYPAWMVSWSTHYAGQMLHLSFCHRLLRATVITNHLLLAADYSFIQEWSNNFIQEWGCWIILGLSCWCSVASLLASRKFVGITHWLPIWFITCIVVGRQEI